MDVYVVDGGSQPPKVYVDFDKAREDGESRIARRPAGWTEIEPGYWCFSDAMSYVHIHKTTVIQ